MDKGSSNYQDRFIRKALSVYDAEQVIIEQVKRESIELVTIEHAYMRRSAQTITASAPVPHFRRSVMDGYAVRAQDTINASVEHPVKLRVVAVVDCGAAWSGQLQEGEAVRIMTGAMVPSGADAVVKLEQTSDMEQGAHGLDDEVSVKEEAQVGDFIHDAGIEIKQGTMLIDKGDVIEAGNMALLAMFGHSYINVYSAPKVAVIPTGHELLSVEAQLEPGKIRNSNSYLLSGLIRDAGGEPHLLPALPDDVDALASRIEDAMQEYDAVITIGGVSVGDRDVLYAYTQQWKGKLLFNKVKMRPGGPTTAGVYHDKLLFALSGNPSSCFVGFEMFVRPALLQMQGVKTPDRVRLRAKLASDYLVKDTVVRLVRGILYADEGGGLMVREAGLDSSNATITIRDANALIVIPPSEQDWAAGTVVDVIPVGRHSIKNR
ncbi:molybdopterin molybdotransferase MoeA [Paenibacillus aquistagni]|uniref:molybdopterin molybdotransferase MoeA n=1 Tax=Paenibacillus aquistagni TaxID=1852522 RepID=UPI00145BD6A7|nr:gephyrin-like molybdotransferase Glp [Paenibacillus aquistagni]NMM55326.1 molybdopterin molybdotransferase MoeA [Paenibacillus aquistagni]